MGESHYYNSTGVIERAVVDTDRRRAPAVNSTPEIRSANPIPDEVATYSDCCSLSVDYDSIQRVDRSGAFRLTPRALLSTAGCSWGERVRQRSSFTV